MNKDEIKPGKVFETTYPFTLDHYEDEDGIVTRDTKQKRFCGEKLI